MAAVLVARLIIALTTIIMEMVAIIGENVKSAILSTVAAHT
jgi:hypothetical protein